MFSSDGAGSDIECFCSQGYWRGDIKVCDPCVEHAFCPRNTTQPVTKAGFWRVPWLSEDHESARLPCEVPKACLGPKNISEAAGVQPRCNMEFGYTDGPLCSVCRRGYVPLSRRCYPCPEKSLNAFLLVLAIVFAIGVLLFLIRLRIRTRSSRKSVHSSVKRILMTHVQIIGIVVGLNVPWPATLVQVVSQTRP